MMRLPRIGRLCVSLLACALLGSGRVAADPDAPPDDTAPRDVIPLDEDIDVAPDEKEPTGFPDPWENTNRKALWLDQQLDRWLISPLISGYQFLVPRPARQAVQRFCLNLNSPQILVNDLLQREWADAGVTTERFLINTTVGIGGLFDPAASLGLERHQADFGQTLALAGVDSGPYLVVPLFGPSTVRDASGSVVDFFLQPALYVLPFAVIFVYEASRSISAREVHDEGLDALRSSSVDFYSALHNAYYQTRMAEIWSRRESRPEPTPAASLATR
jgi:phospholipid-binding lipoprotein MlaA